jgi:low affinity Fe/Cu permease/organic hydroperoxide reductase OsmC/OhrA
MKILYRKIELIFEKLVLVAMILLGNSITFIIALCTVLFWLTNKRFYTQDIHQSIGDVILGVTFLSLFIIQKSFNRFSASLHLKINELVASHEPASNEVINIEEKTELEITELSKEYAELALLAKKIKQPTVNKETKSLDAIKKKMKKLLMLLCLVALFTHLQAQNLSFKNIPSLIITSFKKSYPLASNINWTKQQDNNYSAEFEVAKVCKCATYDAFVMIVESWEKLPYDDLPLIKAEFIDKNYQEYNKVNVVCHGIGKGILSSPAQLKEIEVETPPEFTDIIKEIWTPDHLFVAPINACLTTPFFAIAETLKAKYISYKSNAIGTADKADGFTFMEIFAKPKLVISTGEDDAKVKRVLETSERVCTISNSIKIKTPLEQVITVVLPHANFN